MVLYKIYKSNTSNYPWGCKFMSKTLSHLGLGIALTQCLSQACADRHENFIDIVACSWHECLGTGRKKALFHPEKSISGQHGMAWSTVNAPSRSARGGAVQAVRPHFHRWALMPCCPTFMDGLNLCPQLRQINPDSADIISCSALWHRIQEELPTSALLSAQASPLMALDRN